MSNPIVVSIAVEGIMDAAVLTRLVREAGADPGMVYGKQGKQALLQQLPGYNLAALRAPWVVLIDLNGSFDCAPELVRDSLPAPNPGMCYRVAVREIESWLLADREGLASFLGVPTTRIPFDPDSLPDPKLEMISLARKASRRYIREELIPRPGSGRTVGPGYSGRLMEFIELSWSPSQAALHSDSLNRCRARLADLVERWAT